jgi:hypothetical protein
LKSFRNGGNIQDERLGKRESGGGKNMSEEIQMRVAVIGSGYWGKNLVRNYHALDALKLICDKNETMLAGFKKQYSDVEV